MRICAVVAPGAADVLAAVRAQSRPPETHVEALAGPGLAAHLPPDAEWTWVLDGSVLPRPDALAALLTALAEAPVAAGPPALLTSKVVDLAGGLVTGSIWPRRDAIETTVLAMDRGLLPVRAAAGGSLLVRVSDLASRPPASPRLASPARSFEWTARLLRDRVGLLAPDSVAVLRVGAAAAPGPVGRLRAAVALLRSDAWLPKERLWLGPEVVGGVLGGGLVRSAGVGRRP